MAYRDKLPVLEIVPASPCAAAWEDMSGDGRIRHCRTCDRDVFDLQGLNREEAEALIAGKAGRLCASYFARADGTVMVADCSAQLRLRPSGWWLAAIGSAAAVALTVLAIDVARTPKQPAGPLRFVGSVDILSIEDDATPAFHHSEEQWRVIADEQVGTDSPVPRAFRAPRR